MSGDHRLAEEMEAAEALAGLAQFVVARGWKGGGCGRSWRDGYGKKRMEVKQEEDRKVESSRSYPDLCQWREVIGANASKQCPEMDYDAFRHQECATAGEDSFDVTVKSEQGKVLPDDKHQMCGTSYSPLGVGRSKHNLSEAEKEAKRIRRVMANRESARRTIRRRQDQCEDLTRRAAELTEENMRLKKGIELALKEYKSLETTNKHLKAKMIEEIKPDLQIASTILEPTALGASTSSTNFPILPYNHPLGPVFWPSIIHSSTREHCLEGRSDTALVTTSIIMPGLCRSDLAHDQEKMLNMAGHGSPVHIVPCPWSISLHNPGNECSSATSCGYRRNLNEVSLGNQTYGSSSSGTDSWTENCTYDLFIEVKAEPPNPLTHDLNEPPVESSPLGSGLSNSFPRLAARSLVFGSDAKGEDEISLDLNLSSFEAVPLGSGKQDNLRPTGLYTNQNLGEDTNTICDAKARRKRRREITKLKSIGRRHCRS